jgi:hypothetical protein
MAKIDLDAHVKFTPISVETMSVEELEARTGIELGRALIEIMCELSDVTRMLRESKRKRSEAKIGKIRGEDGSEEAYEIAKLVVDVINDRARMLREMKSAQQSLVRAIPSC